MSAKYLGLSLLLIFITGCATRIIPPAKLQDPVPIYIADYGRHSSILLPTNEGHLIEYAYGDWDFYALNKYRWYIGATALFYSECSCLGRRVIYNPNSEELLRAAVDCKRVIRIDTERRKVLELIDELDHRYNEHIESLVYNEAQFLYFVKDDSHYGMFHTCNQMTAEWLAKLGCEVQGWPVLLPNFEVSQPPENMGEESESAEAAPTPVVTTRPATRPRE